MGLNQVVPLDVWERKQQQVGIYGIYTDKDDDNFICRSYTFNHIHFHIFSTEPYSQSIHSVFSYQISASKDGGGSTACP